MEQSHPQRLSCATRESAQSYRMRPTDSWSKEWHPRRHRACHARAHTGRVAETGARRIPPREAVGLDARLLTWTPAVCARQLARRTQSASCARKGVRRHWWPYDTNRRSLPGELRRIDLRFRDQHREIPRHLASARVDSLLRDSRDCIMLLQKIVQQGDLAAAPRSRRQRPVRHSASLRWHACRCYRPLGSREGACCGDALDERAAGRMTRPEKR